MSSVYDSIDSFQPEQSNVQLTEEVTEHLNVFVFDQFNTSAATEQIEEFAEVMAQKLIADMREHKPDDAKIVSIEKPVSDEGKAEEMLQEAEGINEEKEIADTEEIKDVQLDQPKEETIEEERSVIVVDFEKPQEVEEVEEKVEFPYVKDTVEVEIQQPTEETIEIVKDIIIVEKEKAQEVKEMEEEVETPVVKETVEVEVEQPTEETVEIYKETIVVEKEKPQKVEETTEEVETTTFQEIIEFNIQQSNIEEAEITPLEKPEVPQEFEPDVKEAVHTEAPRFVTSLLDITVLENTRTVMEVVFSGLPAPNVTWFVDDEEILPGDGVDIVTESNRSILIFSEIYPDDEGIYKVELNNKVGSCISTAYITVISSETIAEEERRTYREEISIIPSATNLATDLVQIKESKMEMISEKENFSQEISFDIQKQESHKETIEVQIKIPKELDSFTQSIQISSFNLTEFQPKEEIIEEERSVVNLKKPQDVEEEAPVAKETLEVEQPTEEMVEIYKKTLQLKKKMLNVKFNRLLESSGFYFFNSLLNFLRDK
uniref:Ig-like domain-containing protein n=1 Tax=Biomphalaria glabrata TaxID=6526 RepID=A0A2C9M4R9_BIOGL